MKTNLILATAAALALTSAASRAADMTPYDPSPQPSYSAPMQSQATNWQGAYVGVQVGGGRMHVTGYGNDTAFVGGGHAGYLVQRGSLVAGPEIDIDVTGWDAGGTDVSPALHAKLRAGMAVDNFLVTGSVGYGHMWADGESDGGLTLGAGADMAVSDHVVIGADYQYTNIGNFAGGSEDVTTHTVRSRLSYKFN